MIVLFGKKNHEQEKESSETGKNKEITGNEQQNNENDSKQEKQPETDLKQKQIEELTDLVKRIQAEFENFRKREEKDRQNFVELSNAGLIKSLLPVLDSIDSAKQSFLGKKIEQKTEEIKGIELIEKQLKQVLNSFGLKEMISVGKKFNPEFHDCLIKESNPEKEDSIVLEEIQKGYFLKEKVIRHAKVKINSLDSKEVVE